MGGRIDRSSSGVVTAESAVRAEGSVGSSETAAGATGRTGRSPRVAAFLAANNADQVARRGELVDTLRRQTILAEDDGELVGVLTYIIDDRACEVLTLHATVSWRGIGSALLEALERIAGASGCDRLWLITTNDNVDALRFYQRRGFVMTALHADAVTEARALLKPRIPEIGDYGIPIRDEIEFEKRL